MFDLSFFKATICSIFFFRLSAAWSLQLRKLVPRIAKSSPFFITKSYHFSGAILHDLCIFQHKMYMPTFSLNFVLKNAEVMENCP